MGRLSLELVSGFLGTSAAAKTPFDRKRIKSRLVISPRGGYERLRSSGWSARYQRRMNEMECWSRGVLEYWVWVRHSSTPSLQSSNQLGPAKTIERYEAYESFSAGSVG